MPAHTVTQAVRRALGQQQRPRRRVRASAAARARPARLRCAPSFARSAGRAAPPRSARGSSAGSGSMPASAQADRGLRPRLAGRRSAAESAARRPRAPAAGWRGGTPRPARPGRAAACSGRHDEEDVDRLVRRRSALRAFQRLLHACRGREAVRQHGLVRSRISAALSVRAVEASSCRRSAWRRPRSRPPSLRRWRGGWSSRSTARCGCRRRSAGRCRAGAATPPRPVPTSALWRCFWNVGRRRRRRPGRRAAGHGPWPSANGLSAGSGPSTWKMRTIGMPRAAQPSISALVRAEEGAAASASASRGGGRRTAGRRSESGRFAWRSPVGRA